MCEIRGADRKGGSGACLREQGVVGAAVKKIHALAISVGLVAALTGTAQANGQPGRAPLPTNQITNVISGYVIDSAGKTGSDRVPVYIYKDATNPSDNLRWRYDPATQHIINIATGYALDSGGDTSRPVVQVYAYKDATSPSDNLKWRWDADRQHIVNVATGYALDAGPIRSTSPSSQSLFAYWDNTSTADTLRWKTDIFN